MNIIDALTEQDKKNILTYVVTYAKGDEEFEINAPVPTDVAPALVHWAAAKEWLYQLFGNKFIISKKIEVHKDAADLRMDMYDHVTKATPIRHFIYDHLVDPTDKSYVTEMLFEENLVRNSVSYTHTFGLKNDNGETCEYKMRKGTKVTRAIKALAEKAGATPKMVNDFLTAHSRVMNDAVSEGELCLSIHPLDFMTMSDSGCKWRSCMKWSNGEYRAGTVEMMNSYNVVVAYLKSNNNTVTIEDTDFSWAGKKWRELFIINDDLIFSVKGYPYHSDELERASLEFLAQLRPEHYNPAVREIEEPYITKCYEWNQNARLDFDFMTDGMYNDIYNNDERTYQAIFANDFYCKGTYSFNYSGPATCVYCGELLDTIMDYPNRLLCDHCRHLKVIGKCHCCGADVTINNYCVQIKDYIYCDCCQSEASYRTDNFNTIDGNAYYIYNAGERIKIYLAADETNPTKGFMAETTYKRLEGQYGGFQVQPRHFRDNIYYYTLDDITEWEHLRPFGYSKLRNGLWCDIDTHEKILSLDRWKEIYKTKILNNHYSDPWWYHLFGVSTIFQYESPIDF